MSSPPTPHKLRVAIVHDWLTNSAGAERVVLELHKLFPDAPIYTSVFNPDAMPDFADLDIRTSFLQRIPLARSKHQLFPLLRSAAFSRFNFDDYDLVISSSTAEAKGIKTKPHTPHINYCHTPTRYYWSHYQEYVQNPGLGPLSPVVSRILPLVIGIQRKQDLRAAARPNYYIANSREVQKRIKKYYKRSSVVIAPPVDTNRFKPAKKKQRRNGYVIAGRQVPYKRIDLAVQACTQLNLPLTVIGSGPDHDKLISLAGPSTQFLTSVSDSEIPRFFQQAKAFIFPSYEDFGIVPVEAMAAGTPVIAFHKGGAQDYVIQDKTGIFFKKQTVSSLVAALRKFEATPIRKHSVISQHAEQFSHDAFGKAIKEYIGSIDS